MPRMALEHAYLQLHMGSYTYPNLIDRRVSDLINSWPTGKNELGSLKQDYQAFVSERSRDISRLLQGFSTDEIGRYPTLSMVDENKSRQAIALAAGGLLSLFNTPTLDVLLKLAAVCTLIQLPGYVFPAIARFLLNQEELAWQAVTASLKNGLPFSFKLHVDGEEENNGEKRALAAYKDGLARENLQQVLSFMKNWHAGHRTFLSGPIQIILNLAYFADKDLFARLVAKEGTPVFVNLICEDPQYAYDLETLFKIANFGGLWTRLEILHHLTILLREAGAREASRIKSTKQRAFRRMIAVYIGRVIILLLGIKKSDVLCHILNTLTSIEQSRRDLPLLYYLGLNVGKGIALHLNDKIVEQDLLKWEPFRSSSGLMYILRGVQDGLDREKSVLLSVWNKVLIRKWLNDLWALYRTDVEGSGGKDWPFSALDAAVWNAITRRWKKRSRSVIFINGLWRRLSATEHQWFTSSIGEWRHLGAIYAGILAHAEAWRNLVPDTEIPESVIHILEYVNDQRHWYKVPGDKRETEIPDYFREIRQAYLESTEAIFQGKT